MTLHFNFYGSSNTPKTNAHFERDLIKDLARALEMDASLFRTVELKTLSTDGNFIDVVLDIVPPVSESSLPACPPALVLCCVAACSAGC